MDISTIFPSKYLKAEDFTKPKTVTIKDIRIEKFDEGSKLIVWFEELDKPLVLNKTNTRAMVKICKSNETNDWICRHVTLITVWMDFKGDQVQAIRVRPADDDEPF